MNNNIGYFLITITLQHACPPEFLVGSLHRCLRKIELLEIMNATRRSANPTKIGSTTILNHTHRLCPPNDLISQRRGSYITLALQLLKFPDSDIILYIERITYIVSTNRVRFTVRTTYCHKHHHC